MKIDITKIIGFVLLMPALVCVVLFIKTIFDGEGSINIHFASGSPSSITLSLPFYIGVTAIVGAYLIKDKK